MLLQLGVILFDKDTNIGIAPVPSQEIRQALLRSYLLKLNF